MNITQCLDKYQVTGIRHFRLVYSGVPYDIIIDKDSAFSLLDWTITMRRETPMGIIEDCELWDEHLILKLEMSDNWMVL